ncbi:hypothetical protein ACFY0G_39785 [Streptomyces sp. NPDC001552]|uniref:hypothetical protein n=1 Tax=Streptomyces sp. NPDC001552 TaxID=3364587 RepID=UPI003681FD3C
MRLQERLPLTERPVPRRLLIRQELDRHNGPPKIDNIDPRRLEPTINLVNGLRLPVRPERTIWHGRSSTPSLGAVADVRTRGHADG